MYLCYVCMYVFMYVMYVSMHAREGGYQNFGLGSQREISKLEGLPEISPGQ